MRSATVNVTPAQNGRAVVTIADAAATPSTRVLASLTPSDDHDLEWLEGYTLFATCEAGAVRCVITHAGPIAGAFTITYTLG
jgi:hypothetical protein